MNTTIKSDEQIWNELCDYFDSCLAPLTAEQMERAHKMGAIAQEIADKAPLYIDEV